MRRWKVEPSGVPNRTPSLWKPLAPVAVNGSGGAPSIFLCFQNLEDAATVIVRDWLEIPPCFHTGETWVGDDVSELETSDVCALGLRLQLATRQVLYKSRVRDARRPGSKDAVELILEP